MDGMSINKYAQVMFRLRGMGLYTNKIMSRHLPGRGDGDHEQFLIACLVTGNEIWHCDTGVLDEYKDFLRGVKQFQFDERFIRHGRVVVVLNAEGHHTHGEARLLDVDGELRHRFGLNVDNEESYDYLEAMSNEFVNKFGYDEQAYLMMFSHYVPCTLESHQCASLVGQYAEQSEHKVVVGYKDVFEDIHEASDESDAIDVMEQHGVLVIYPGTLASVARQHDYGFKN